MTFNNSPLPLLYFSKWFKLLKSGAKSEQKCDNKKKHLQRKASREHWRSEKHFIVYPALFSQSTVIVSCLPLSGAIITSAMAWSSLSSFVIVVLVWCLLSAKTEARGCQDKKTHLQHGSLSRESISKTVRKSMDINLEGHKKGAHEKWSWVFFVQTLYELLGLWSAICMQKRLFLWGKERAW